MGAVVSTAACAAAAPQILAIVGGTLLLQGVVTACAATYEWVQHQRFVSVTVSLVENPQDFCALVYHMDNFNTIHHQRLVRFEIRGTEHLLRLPQKACWISDTIHVQPGKSCPASRDAIDTLTISAKDLDDCTRFLDDARASYEAQSPNRILQYQWDGTRWKSRCIGFDASESRPEQRVLAMQFDRNAPGGVLLVGPPGSGKSTSIYAAASEQKKKVYLLPAGVEDAELVRALALIPPHSVLVADNWDQLGEDRKLTKAMILNVLDSRHVDNWVVVCVNDRDVLEQEICGVFRPGRVDTVLQFTDKKTC